MVQVQKGGSAQYNAIVKALGLDKPLSAPKSASTPSEDRFAAVMAAINSMPKQQPKKANRGTPNNKLGPQEKQRIIRDYKGKQFKDLPVGLQERLVKTGEADEISKSLGKPRKKKRSLLTKALHAIMKPSSAMQEGFNEAIEQTVFDAKDKDGDRDLGDLVKSTGKFFKGVKKGWNADYGKQTTLSDTIQEFYDRKNETDRGRDDDTYTPGKAKVSPWLKYGVGLVGEIAMDPTTYLTGGTSVVARAGARGGREAAENLNKVAKQVEEITKTAPALKGRNAAGEIRPELQDILKATGVDFSPKLGLRGKKALTPEGKKVYEWARTQQKLDPAGTKVTKTMTSRLSQKGSTGAKYKEILASSGDNIVKNWYATRRAALEADATKAGKNLNDPKVKADIRKALKTEQAALKITPERFSKELTATMLRNMDDDLATQVKIKLGPATIAKFKPKDQAAEIGLELLKRTKAGAFTGKVLKDGVTRFNDTLRASAGIAPALNHIRQANWGYAARVTRAYADESNSVFLKTPVRDRSDLFRSVVGHGNTSGYTPIQGGTSVMHGGQQVELGKYIQDEVRNLDTTLKQLDMSEAQVKRWFAYLGKDLRTAIPTTKAVAGQQGYQTGKATTALFNPDWFMDSVKAAAKRGEDPARVIYSAKIAVERAVARKGMMDSIIDTWGVNTRKNVKYAGGAAQTYGNRLAQNLTRGKDGWRTPNVDGLKGHVFEPEMATAIERLFDVFDNAKTTDDFMGMFDKGTRAWKAIVTRYNPAFHTRTLMGEMVLGFIGGVVNPRRYEQAAKVLYKRNEEFFGPGLQTVTGGSRRARKAQVERANILLHPRYTNSPNSASNAAATAARPSGNDIVLVNKASGLRYTNDQVWHLYNEMGLKSGYLSNELVTGLKKHDPFGKVTAKVNQVSEATEDFPRLAHFIDTLAKTKLKDPVAAAEEAAQAVRKYHLDYTNVTKAEQQYATRLIPFYKWLRLSAPIMAQAMFTNPGRVVAMDKTLEHISGMRGYDFTNGEVNADIAMPEWLRETAPLPMFESSGNTNYFNRLPISPLGPVEIGQGGTEKVAGLLNPLGGVPMQYLLNKSPVGAPPQEDKDRFLAAQSPHTNLIYKLLNNDSGDEPDWELLLKFISNPGFQPNTRSRIEQAIVEDQRNAGAYRNDVSPETEKQRKTREKKEAKLAWPT